MPTAHSISILRPTPITADAFAPFGQLIAARGAAQAINAGSATRYDGLAPIELLEPGARAALGIVRASAARLPFSLRLLERHRLGSQAFVPMAAQRFVVVVAADAAGNPELQNLRALLCDGSQGVSYAAGTWHHPLIALDAGDFLVVDRIGNDSDCEECALEAWRLEVTG